MLMCCHADHGVHGSAAHRTIANPALWAATMRSRTLSTRPSSRRSHSGSDNLSAACPCRLNHSDSR
eukprot:6171337-Heterocapsa_arctica.AAC.1